MRKGEEGQVQGCNTRAVHRACLILWSPAPDLHVRIKEDQFLRIVYQFPLL